MALERGAARQVDNAAGLAAAAALYFEQPALREAAARAAQSLVAENQGALERTLALITDALRRRELAGEQRAAAAPAHRT